MQNFKVEKSYSLYNKWKQQNLKWLYNYRQFPLIIYAVTDPSLNIERCTFHLVIFHKYNIFLLAQKNIKISHFGNKTPKLSYCPATAFSLFPFFFRSFLSFNTLHENSRQLKLYFQLHSVCISLDLLFSILQFIHTGFVRSLPLRT